LFLINIIRAVIVRLMLDLRNCGPNENRLFLNDKVAAEHSATDSPVVSVHLIEPVIKPSVLIGKWVSSGRALPREEVFAQHNGHCLQRRNSDDDTSSLAQAMTPTNMPTAGRLDPAGGDQFARLVRPGDAMHEHDRHRSKRTGGWKCLLLCWFI